MQAVIYKSTGTWYIVRDEEGVFRNARIRGKLKIDTEISSTNPLAVGDVVTADPEPTDAETLIVREIAARKNYMVRVSPHNKTQKHIIAANLDLAILVASIADPRTSQGFIDRFLVTAEVYHIPALIVVNKADLIDQKGRYLLDHWQVMYTKAGYPLL